MAKCSVCNKEFKQGEYRVDNKAIVYCRSCNPSLFGDIAEKNRKSSKERIPYPREIKEELDNYVIGQDKAKKTIAIATYNHFKRIDITSCQNAPIIDKSNVMIIGPSGSGKTHLLRNLAKILDITICLTNALNITEAGYRGDDVNSLLERLISSCPGSTKEEQIRRAERSILFIDEIDKLAVGANEAKEQVGGIGVQQALLPILEGARIPVFDNKYTIDTTNILFIVGGAFPGLDKNNITTEALHEYGFSTEFLGRIPVRTCLNNLSVDDLLHILVEPKDSIIKQYQQLFEYDGIELTFEEEALIAIAANAYKLGCGARGLRTVLEETLSKAQFDYPGSEVTNVTVLASDVVAPAY